MATMESLDKDQGLSLHYGQALDKDKSLDDGTAHTDAEYGSFLIDPEREKAVVRKLDLYISPLMTLVFLCAYLDRANIGNAASAGMTTDLKMSSDELGSELLLVLCASYSAFIWLSLAVSLKSLKVREPSS